MQATLLSDKLSVSAQISAADIEKLQADGVEIIVCNRPDGEEDNQPSFAEIATACQQAGAKAINIAFAGGQMNQQHIDAFAQVLSENKRTHAYCRTGNRSTQLWQANCSQAE